MSRNLFSLDNTGPRNIAVNSLLAFERRSEHIHKSLDSIFSAHSVCDSDRRLATELAYGTCRRLITLDHLIRRHSKRNLSKIDPGVLQILRVGLYQLIFLTRTPDFAAVSEAVQQTKFSGLKGADAFVNAVLRSVQRDIKGPVKPQHGSPSRNTIWIDAENGCAFKSDFLPPPPTRNPSKYYSLAFSHPAWLLDRWLRQYDSDTVERICRADNSRPSLWLRVNQLRISPEQFHQNLTEAGFDCKRTAEAVLLSGPVVPEKLPGFNEGWFYVQDLSAMAVSKMLAPLPGQRILDLCGAPGGKTTHLAELMENKGAIVACDLSSSKLELIEENCQRLGVSIVQCRLAEQLEDICLHDGLFDAVLLDVPCSNTGVLARRVEVRHRLKPVDIQRLKKLQIELLHKAASLVKPRGSLVYSTCSIDAEENELLVEKFLQQNHSFQSDRCQLYLPQTDSLLDETSAAPLPAQLGPRDGGYAVRLIRT